MRKLLLTFIAALLFGLALPSGADAARGDFDQPGRGYRVYSGNGVYIGRSPRYQRFDRRRFDLRRYNIRRSPGVYLYVYPSAPRRVYRKSRSSCSYWSRRCVANWGYNNANYRGCMRYHRCY